MHALLETLREVCRRVPLREKVVVVPSLAIGHQIGDALARGGTPWINLRFETTRTIADAVAGFALQAEGWRVLSRAQALAILERACDRVLDDSSYFAELAGRPGLYRAIQRSVDDLRHAGLETLQAEAFEEPRKARDLSAILAAYEGELREQKFIDRFGVLARAIALATPWDVEWVVGEGLELTPAEEKLLAAAGAVVRPATRVRDAAGIKSVRFVRAAGEENEIRGALRTILRDKVPFDSAEVLYTSRDPYLALAFELTSQLAIPATFAEGIPVTFTRPGQAALGFLHWLAGDFDAARLQRIARAGAIKTGSEVLSPFSFGRILRAAMIGWGRERYVPRLEAYLARLESEPEIARVRETLKLVHALLDVVDAPSLAESTLRFLDTFAATRNEVDGMALAALRRMLHELMELPPATTSIRAAMDRLGDAIAAIHVSASNPRPGHLHVAPIRSGGWSGRTALFVLGLDDVKHPGSGLQDPILLDAERHAIGRLELLGDAPARNSARLRALFARAPEARWTVSYTELDLRDRRARFPSRDLLEVYRGAKGADATYVQLATEATPVGFLENEVPLSPTEWWLGQRDRDGVLAAHPWLAAGERARIARESDAITEYDGRIAVAREEIDPRLTGRVLSASQMEKMARCPFGWFLERVLKIEPVEELERVADQWLDARDFGSLVHEVLQKVMDELSAAEALPSLETHLERMHAIAEEALAEWRAEVPPGTETAFARQREELLAACEVFLRTEERGAARIVPRYFELPFGQDDDVFAISLGGGREVRLRGSIDRVDQDVATGDWEVWDYKTGSLYEYHDVWRLKRGTKLQHAVYSRALEEILRARGLSGKVQCAGYYFPTTKGGGERSARACEPGELEHALNLMFDVIGSGWFPQPDQGSCGFCPYPDICGAKELAAERLARKQAANAADPAVRAWRDLQEVE
jgi:ATP-dependent helicase/nuclease subunit B